MAAKVPLVIVNGRLQQLQAGDTIAIDRLNLGTPYEVTAEAAETIDLTDATSSLILVDGAAEGIVTNILGGVLGDFIVIKKKPGTGSFVLAGGATVFMPGSTTLDEDRDSHVFVFNGTKWVNTGRVQ